MGFEIGFAIATIPTILSVVGTTLIITALSCAGAAGLGFAFEMIRRSGWTADYVMRFVIDFIRATPVLGWLYFMYFVLPFYGVRLPTTAVGILGLSVYYSGYLAEVFRAGIDAVAKGQQEAARALGLGRVDAVVFVIAPQMLRNIAAPMGNYFVSILKATPYLAAIAVPEMLGSAFDIASDTYRYAEPLTVAGVMFLLLALAVTGGVKQLERKLLKADRR
ncbi:amino acid ABC transporter permease [Aminobacter aganoensis]|uniref:Polar amino acid transport system permease protein n=1 Tax=Aminobacter aganoensis TaxID=83264 RepID=A0A7X0KNE3_9HYPH|nr:MULTISPECIES: amino acid ABC transporter permease [Aminobacter]KQU74491.1 ABC transporter [Aminobacter sp. DSM 101952]MBB6357091.1 polar amino acid transport system permease protein [Aminobacter aganoensis]